MTAVALDVVLAWHDALAAGDVDRVVALTDENVEVAGPRGIARGHAIVRDWASSAGLVLAPGRTAERGGTVIVEQAARWHGGESLRVATVFEVRDSRIARIARHDDGWDAALAAAGLEL